MPVSKCPGLGFSSEQHCPSLYPLNWIQSSPNGWKLNSFSFVPRIHFKWRGHGRQMQLLQRCEIEMACHVPWYWARTETWISLSFQLKLRGASMEAGQVCWGFIFYLLVIPLKLPTQPAIQPGGTRGVEANCRLRDTLAVDWEANKLPHHYQKSDERSTTTAKHMLHQFFPFSLTLRLLAFQNEKVKTDINNHSSGLSFRLFDIVKGAHIEILIWLAPGTNQRVAISRKIFIDPTQSNSGWLL